MSAPQSMQRLLGADSLPSDNAARTRQGVALRRQRAHRPAPPEAVIDPADPPVLGANPFVGLTRQQLAAAAGRLLQRMAVDPGVVLADGLEVAGELLKV